MLSGGTGALTGTELSGFLQEVRDLIQVGLTTEELSDDLLSRMIFFRASELNLIRLLGDSQSEYDAKLGVPDFKLRAETWIASRMAAAILPALPQILEEGILDERVRYQQLDIEKRIELLLV